MLQPKQVPFQNDQFVGTSRLVELLKHPQPLNHAEPKHDSGLPEGSELVLRHRNITVQVERRGKLRNCDQINHSIADCTAEHDPVLSLWCEHGAELCSKDFDENFH